MKPPEVGMKNHQPLDLIRVCELQVGNIVMLSGGEYKVTDISADRVTCRRIDGFKCDPQYFKAKSQQKVELVKSENHDKKEKALRLPISENGQVRH